MQMYLIMAADVPALRGGNFHTQIISLKEGLAKIEEVELTREKRFMLAEKV
jgi:hypothetical protein